MRVVIVTLLIAAGLAGCSPDLERQGQSFALGRAEATTREVGTVRVRTTLRSNVGGVVTSARGEGAIDFRSGRVSMAMTGTVGQRVVTWETIAEAHALYTRTFGSEWSVVRSKSPGGPVRQMVFKGWREPAHQLALLPLVKNVGRIGAENVDGVTTTRYTGEADIAGYQLETVDFWLDDQWRIRRLRTFTISGEGRQIATTEFYKYGAKIPPIVTPRR